MAVERFLNEDAYIYLMSLIDDLGGIDLEQLQADIQQARSIADEALSTAETAETTATGAATTVQSYGSSITALQSDVTAVEEDVTALQTVSNGHTTDIAALQSGKVPTTRKVNNKALSSDITLAASDVNAAPIDHSSTNNTYGLGTTSNYGHVKIVNNLTQSSYSDGTVLAAYQGNVLNTNKAAKSSFKSYGTSTYIYNAELTIGTSEAMTAGQTKTFSKTASYTYGVNNKIAIGLLGFEITGTGSGRIAIGNHWFNPSNQTVTVQLINTDTANAATLTIKAKLLVVNYGF